MKTIPFLLIICCFLVSCSTTSGSGSNGPVEQAQQALVEQYFSSEVDTFTIHVFYEQNAQPYTGNIGLTSGDTWDYTFLSIQALFDRFTNRSIEVPTQISDMNIIETQNKQTWSLNDLTELGDNVFESIGQIPDIGVAIIFVSGTYEASENILGIHPTSKPYAFIFKDVIQSVGGTNSSQKQMEQAVVVHELGHVIGLVNNGIHMAQNHEDDEHPHHTTNSSCVMYWAVENKNNIGSYLDALTGNTQNLFGEQSIADADQYQP